METFSTAVGLLCLGIILLVFAQIFGIFVVLLDFDRAWHFYWMVWRYKGRQKQISKVLLISINEQLANDHRELSKTQIAQLQFNEHDLQVYLKHHHYLRFIRLMNLMVADAKALKPADLQADFKARDKIDPRLFQTILKQAGQMRWTWFQKIQAEQRQADAKPQAK